MGAVSELRVMRRSFSGDASRSVQSRSGDDQSGGAPLFDYVAHVQSAEADIIEREERAERQESKRRFVRLLRLYFRKILSEQERQFLAACLRSGETPYKVGRALGLDYRTVIESVQRKHEANAPRLAALMRAVGYDCRRGLEFIPTLLKYCNTLAYIKAYNIEHREELKEKERQRNAANPERLREIKRRFTARHPERVREEKRKYREANRDKINAWRRAHYAAHREELKAKRAAANKAYRAAYRDEINAKLREYRAAHREENAARSRAYYAAYRDEINARERAYRAAHPEEVRAKDRAKYARKKARAQAREGAASEQADRQSNA